MFTLALSIAVALFFEEWYSGLQSFKKVIHEEKGESLGEIGTSLISSVDWGFINIRNERQSVQIDGHVPSQHRKSHKRHKKQQQIILIYREKFL